jgi:hypothetical protein
MMRGRGPALTMLASYRKLRVPERIPWDATVGEDGNGMDMRSLPSTFLARKGLKADILKDSLSAGEDEKEEGEKPPPNFLSNYAPPSDRWRPAAPTGYSHRFNSHLRPKAVTGHQI